MPVYKCPNGKFRIGTGPCVFDSKEKAEKAYAAYRAKKHMKENNKDFEGLFEILAKGRGNWGHAGRPGHYGGSSPNSAGGEEFVVPSGRQSRIPLSGYSLLNSDLLNRKLLELGGQREPQQPGMTEGKLLGFYDAKEKRIYINSELPKSGDVKFGGNSVNPTQEGVFYHEYGHHLWINELSFKEKKNWENVYFKVKPDYWRTQISWKASKGPDEAFSELYTVHAKGIDVSSRLKANKKASILFKEIDKIRNAN
jgi:hypothetical protein